MLQHSPPKGSDISATKKQTSLMRIAIDLTFQTESNEKKTTPKRFLGKLRLLQDYPCYEINDCNNAICLPACFCRRFFAGKSIA